MAAQVLLKSGSQDFGIIELGQSQTIQITFENQSSPSISMDVSLSGLTADFAYGTGDDAFTLASNGATRVVDITWTPSAPGIADDTLIITHDAPDPASPWNTALTAQCGKIFTEYSLPDIENNPAGTMSVFMYLENDVSAPTIPDDVRITRIGMLEELVDVEPGVVDIESLEIEAAEDYSTYSEGFWYHVVETNPDTDIHFKFILTEDGTDTVYFYGRIKREDIEWPEHYLATDESSAVRTVRMRLVSMLDDLKTLSIEGTIVTVLANPIYAGLQQYSMQTIIAAILTGMTGQTYNTSYVHVRNSDIRFVDGSANTVYPINACNSGGENTESTVDSDVINKGYFFVDAADDNRLHWTYRYESAFDLLRAICLTFGWTCRYFYGQADGSYAGDSSDKHRLELITRGQSGSTVTPEKGVQESTLLTDSSTRVMGVRVGDLLESSTLIEYQTGPSVYAGDPTMNYAWQHAGAESLVAPDASYAYTYTVSPKYAEFDIDLDAEFIVNDVPGSSGSIGYYYKYRNLYRHDGAGGVTQLETAGFYDYIAGAWVDGEYTIQNALVKYYTRRFRSGRKTFTRKYGSLRFDDGSTTSHANIKPMAEITIDDGIVSETYYASEVRKDFTRNEVTVTWIQE